MATTSDYLAATNAALNTTANAIAQSNVNRRTRKWNEQMYERQRQHALENWHLQNEYNHPSSQMARLREAGLNPNMVYGSGTAAATSTQQAANVSPNSWSPQAMSFDSPLMRMYDVMQREAQTDNLRVQNTVLEEEALLKRTQRLREEFDLGLETDLRDYSADARIADSRSRSMDADMKNLDLEALKWYTEKTGVTPRIQDVLLDQMQKNLNRELTGEQIRSIRNDADLKALDIELRQLGINPQDPVWMRIIGRALNNLIDKFKLF